VEILAISFIVLFQELALIRWLPGQVRVLAYFPNLILISAFLGLGVGCLTADRKRILWLWPVSLLAVATAAIAMSQIAFTQESITEHLWLLYHDLPDGAPVIQAVQPPIIVIFILSAISFVPLGQLLAQRLDIFRARSSSLWGYCWDLMGSLFGVIGFAAVGVIGLFPWMWFSVFLTIGLVFIVPKTRTWPLYAATALAIVFAVTIAERAQWYSPYYAISVVPEEDKRGFSVLTNGSLHQVAYPLEASDEYSASEEHSASWGLRLREGYHHPYRQLKRPPGRVLVLGAGTGNDVAVLLDSGAERIDAVEIDPVILDLGANHPNNPYASDRVRLINTDARSYLNDTEEVYDLIVFGTLDSMTRLSALSNVRLDNYVYTLECIQAARSRLSSDGGMVLYFMVKTRYIEDRLFALVATAFDDLPVVSTKSSGLFNRTFMAGSSFDHLPKVDPAQRRLYFQSVLPTLEIPTDDWPYLYLRSRSISMFYMSLIAVFIALSTISVFVVSRDMRRSLFGRSGVDIEMFLFGVGFLLIETKFITAMNLIWGATWLTSAVVFGSVLAMILLSTLAMQLRPITPWFAISGLLGSLLCTYFIPMRWLLVDDWGARLALSIVFVGTPIFFAAACFAIRFKVRQSAGVAFGWNLLGAVVGGLLEFLSMIVGLKALSLVALTAYLGAIFVWRRSRTRNTDSAVST